MHPQKQYVPATCHAYIWLMGYILSVKYYARIHLEKNVTSVECRTTAKLSSVGLSNLS